MSEKNLDSRQQDLQRIREALETSAEGKLLLSRFSRISSWL